MCFLENTCEIFKNVCFEEHLQTAASGDQSVCSNPKSYLRQILRRSYLYMTAIWDNKEKFYGYSTFCADFLCQNLKNTNFGLDHMNI